MVLIFKLVSLGSVGKSNKITGKKFNLKEVMLQGFGNNKFEEVSGLLKFFFSSPVSYLLHLCNDVFKLLIMQKCSNTFLTCCDKNEVRALLLCFCFYPQNLLHP